MDKIEILLYDFGFRFYKHHQEGWYLKFEGELTPEEQFVNEQGGVYHGDNEI